MVAACTFLILSFGILALMGRSALAAEPDPPRVDTSGDPLPTEARLRLGTTRYRTESSAGAALSPDGKTLAVCGHSAIVLLDAATGKESKRFPHQDPSGTGSISFSPDGSKIGVTSHQGLQILDASSGRREASIQTGFNRGGMETLAFSRDGKRVALGSELGGQKLTATVWEIDGGKKIQSVEVVQDYQARVALSGDGKMLATWGQHIGRGGERNPDLTRTIQLWDVSTGKELKKVLSTEYMPAAVALSPDGKQLAIVEAGAGLNLYDVETDKIQHRLAARRGTGSVLCYSPDGKRIVAGTWDGAVQVWDSATGKRLGMASGPECSIRSIAFLPDNKVLAAGSNGQAIHLLEVPSGRLLTPPDGHSAPPTSLAFSSDGKSVLSCGMDGILFWDAATGKFQRRMTPRDRFEQIRIGVAQLQLLLDGRQLLYASQHNGPVRLVEVATDQEVFALTSSVDHSGLVAAFSSDGKSVALAGTVFVKAGGQATTVQVWDLVNGREKASLPVNGDRVTVAISADGCFVLTSATLRIGGRQPGSELTLWDAATGKEKWKHASETVWMTQLAFSPDGASFASVGQEGVRVCDTATGTNQRLFDHSKEHGSACLLFSRDGRTLAVGGGPEAESVGKVGLWETATAKRRGEFVGHRGIVTTLAFSPDGHTLASSSADTTVLLWDMTGSLSETVRKAAKPDAAEKLWDALADEDAEKSYRLIQSLTAHPKVAVALVKSKLPAVKAPKVDETAIEKWVADLDNEDFDRREQASKGLAKIGRPAAPALSAALKDASAEKKRRLSDLLDALKVTGPRPEMLRPTRALELLERIGTAEAKEVLADLAKGDPDAPLTREASATLKRLSTP